MQEARPRERKTTFELATASLAASGQFNTENGMLMTGAAVAAIPVMLVSFTFQRYFVEGIRLGGVKGEQ